MKKLISALFVSLCFAGFQTSAQAADVSFSVGFAGNQGGYHATGIEEIADVNGNNTNSSTVTEEAGVFEDSHPSFFLELNIGDNMTEDDRFYSVCFFRFKCCKKINSFLFFIKSFK